MAKGLKISVELANVVREFTIRNQVLELTGCPCQNTTEEPAQKNACDFFLWLKVLQNIIIAYIYI